MPKLYSNQSAVHSLFKGVFVVLPSQGQGRKLNNRCYNEQSYLRNIMSKTKVQTLKGFRDFLPQEKRVRDFVAAEMRKVFERYGFEPLETPTLEYAELLLGKYGQEADKLVYTFEDRGERQVGLRYDQTVPTSRVLGQYQQELPKFFRRYQMQNVFRADKPQRGRYREFAQCDCDIFGTKSTLADAEVLAVFYDIYRRLGLESLVIEVNDRQTLFAALSPFANDKVDVFSIVQTIDKLDKQTGESVAAELVRKGLAKEAAEAILIEIANASMSDNLRDIADKAVQLGVPEATLKFNPKLARGLDYYTGLIFEGRLPEYTVGSIGGGGRYDNLIGDLSGVSMPAIGFGIGFDRTVEAVQQLGQLPEINQSAQVLVTLFDEKFQNNALDAARQLREAGIAVEIYPDLDKLGKQFKLANQKNIPFVAIIGEQEVVENKLALKNMETGDQELLSVAEAIDWIAAA